MLEYIKFWIAKCLVEIFPILAVFILISMVLLWASLWDFIGNKTRKKTK